MTIELKNEKKVKVIEIVEDDTSLRDILGDKLIRESFKVLLARDGVEGLALALREHPDLIVLDILMPNMDGLEMMKRLRQENEWSKKVPIILLSNLSADDEKINQAIAENEPAYYLVKSNLKIEDLVGKINERLSRQP